MPKRKKSKNSNLACTENVMIGVWIFVTELMIAETSVCRYKIFFVQVDKRSRSSNGEDFCSLCNGMEY